MVNMLIFGGTSEGRALSQALSGRGFQVTVSVATGYGEGLLEGTRCRVLTGRLDEEEMTALMHREKFTCIIDATHPYAAQASQNIQRACRRAGVARYRLGRSAGETGGCTLAETPAEAARLLEKRQGNILLTTGSKDLDAFAGIARERLYVRILPSAASLEAARRAGVAPSRLICMQGPFSVELNAALLRQWNIAVLVSKCSGRAGGFSEKLEAARQAGAEVIAIGRPEEEDALDWETLMQRLEEAFGRKEEER